MEGQREVESIEVGFLEEVSIYVNLKDEKELVSRKSSGRISQIGETTYTMSWGYKQAKGGRKILAYAT